MSEKEIKINLKKIKIKDVYFILLLIAALILLLLDAVLLGEYNTLIDKYLECLNSQPTLIRWN